jgi:hypothetical protein
MKRGFLVLLLAAAAATAIAGESSYKASNQPMQFSLFKPCSQLLPQCELRVLAQGDIQLDSAAALEAFLAQSARQGVSAPWVCFDSPGGSLLGALAMGSLIRSKGLDTCMARTYTDVREGRAQPIQLSDQAWCASVCAYVLAGGVNRRFAQDAVVAVHQFYSTHTDAGQDLTQRLMTQLGRYLDSMGVERALLDMATQTGPTQVAALSEAQMLKFHLKTEELAAAAREMLSVAASRGLASPG